MAGEAVGRRRAREAKPPAALALCWLLVTMSAGCSLLLDFSEKADAGPGGDADVVDAGPIGDGGDPCNAFEPNDTLSAAVGIEPGTYEPLAICPVGDHDYFSFEIGDNQDVVVEAFFSNEGGAGDLEMRLYNSSGEVVARSESFSDNERIERSLAASNQLLAGTYLIEMYGFHDTTENEYSLVLTVTTP